VDWMSNFFGQLFNTTAITPTAQQPQQTDVQGILFKNGLGALWRDEWQFAETNEDLIRMGGPDPNPLPTRQQYYAAQRGPQTPFQTTVSSNTLPAPATPEQLSSKGPPPVASPTDENGPFGADVTRVTPMAPQVEVPYDPGEFPVEAVASANPRIPPNLEKVRAPAPLPALAEKVKNTVLNEVIPKVTNFVFSPVIEGILAKTAKEYGVDLNLLRMFAKIESSGNPNLRNGNSQYMGLFQLSMAEFKKHGGLGSIFDANENAKAAAIKMKAEAAEFQKKYGRPATAMDLYMIHQQGPSGYPAHLKNPDELAWKNLRPFYSSDAMAKKAVWGNVPSDMRKGLTADTITSGQFLAIWREKIKKWGGTT
jgi:hypothetical protein